MRRPCAKALRLPKPLWLNGFAGIPLGIKV